MLKIGNKVRNKTNNTEGFLIYSTSGASVSGYITGEDGKGVRFQTLGCPIHEIEEHWKRIYKFKYNMKDYN